MGFSRQEYWSQLPCPPSGDLPDPEIKHRSSSLQADSLPLSHQGSPTTPLILGEQSSTCYIYLFPTLHFGEGNGTPRQYSCLENPMDGGAWWAAVHGVATSQTRLSDFTFTFHFHALEKAMATHSSVLAWRNPGSLVGCCLWGRVGSDITEGT